MISFCTLDTDGISLFVNRATIFAVCTWGAIFCSRRAMGHHNYSMVTRLLWAVPALTMTSLVLMVGDLMLRCQVTLSTWERTIYGGLLIWTIAALLAVIISGHRQVENAVALSEKYRDQLQRAVQQLAERELMQERDGDE